MCRRMRAGQVILLVGLIFSVLSHASVASQVTLAWDPSPDTSKVAGYKVYFGQQDFTGANGASVSIVGLSAGTNTTMTVSNLASSLTYFFAAVAVDRNGIESRYSNLISYSVPQDPTNTPTTTIEQTSLSGVVPRLRLYPTNGYAMLVVQGALGANFEIQSSTNTSDANSWKTVANVTLTDPSPDANPNPTTTLGAAFVPSTATIIDPDPIDGTMRYYRIYMPLGFPILADRVLIQQGYDARLIAIRSPNFKTTVVCYVSDEAAYLEYLPQTAEARLRTSGPMIREIATRFADSLGQQWSSASEFTVASDGTKILFATVLASDDPSTDPPLDTPRNSPPDIPIDF